MDQTPATAYGRMTACRDLGSLEAEHRRRHRWSCGGSGHHRLHRSLAAETPRRARAGARHAGVHGDRRARRGTSSCYRYRSPRTPPSPSHPQGQDHVRYEQLLPLPRWPDRRARRRKPHHSEMVQRRFEGVPLVKAFNNIIAPHIPQLAQQSALRIGAPCPSPVTTRTRAPTSSTDSGSTPSTRARWPIAGGSSRGPAPPTPASISLTQPPRVTRDRCRRPAHRSPRQGYGLRSTPSGSASPTAPSERQGARDCALRLAGTRAGAGSAADPRAL